MEAGNHHIASRDNIIADQETTITHDTAMATSVPGNVNLNKDISESDEVIEKALDTLDASIASVVLPSRPLTLIKERDNFTRPTTSDSQAPKHKTPVVNFHVDSDVFIQVKAASGQVTFKVSSANLAFASPVWRSIIYGDHTTRSDAEDWVIKVDGNPQALHTVFDIIHYKFNGVPEVTSLDELYEIAAVTSQYLCTHLVYPWARKWLKNFSSYAADVDCHHNCHKAVFIAWVFGDVQLFSDMADALTVSAKLNANGELVNVDDKPLKKMVLPYGLPNDIAETRLATISKMLDALNAPFKQTASKVKDRKASFCKLNTQQRECEAMMLGSAIPTMVTEGIFPVPNPSHYLDSIGALKSKIEAIHTITYAGKDWKPHLSHSGCNLGYQKAVSKCLKGMPVLLQDEYIKHLVVQAKISGIDNRAQSEECLRRCLSTPGDRPESAGSELNSKRSDCHESGSGEDVPFGKLRI
ncbi:uncharacterized protein F4822DRAFT_302346 [Hypoxylon trugodes]|uniref:uncharacterized protein n=1 Tax=Hypoxylon trugodes TaxID=326681 RepID=UPI002190EBE7|nr:uncharacterized protein F4822DRAFT_302346 [Hypoxylon trugodes]KAI1388103.1 hypothetical protein F4822DRAFT_302346 [Hypoxylon trugodes]